MPNCRRQPNVKNTLRGRSRPASRMSERIHMPMSTKLSDTGIKEVGNSNRKRTIRFMDDEALDVTELSSSSESLSPSPANSTSSSSFSSNHTDIPLRFRRYEGKFENRRGQSLFYFALFPPEKMPVRGVALYIHGSSSHCRRHIDLYKELCKEGFGVISYDLANHGASDLDQHKTRAHITNFQYLVDDTNAFITYAKRSIYTDALRYWRKYHYPRHPHGQNPRLVALPEPPLIIIGSSLGSLVGIHTVLTAQHKFHAAVWAAPTVGVTWNPLLYAESLLPLAMFIPKARIVPAVSHDLFCRDPAFLEAFKNDPLTCIEKMTVRSGTEALNAIKRLQNDKRVTQTDSAFCTIPMLFIAGSNDGVSDQQAAIRFFASMGNLDKEFKLIDGGFHFVFEDTQKEDAIDHLVQWLRARFPLETRNGR
ncbi:hypothetical protein PPTG_09162 [Phytophthora nicotianae INRA-310]|uniref:Serine aminopeptidase S33 domain-containing protein n=1 Tax=Phytophthora nicotianae (strain INRA-310) TaxID=761204 RepID=W2QHH8_PHYN3|nr:hypothetical protein PPTG_09162 [Phytophthora nicotianae INRA-310]ETN12296.1 hypothetical protein PPTG_09162 [Phytophthora nicotianae INRA-310]